MRRPGGLTPRGLVTALRAWLGRRPARRPPLATAAGRYVNRIISDAILFNETPSPTENEGVRAAFVADRLEEFGIAEVQLGGDGSVSCALPAADATADYLLLVANTDNPGYSPLGSLVRLTEREASGIGIADNGVGVAALLVLAEYMHKEQVPLGVNLVLLFAPMSSATALEAFVREHGRTFRAALFVSGLQLGDVEDPVARRLRAAGDREDGGPSAAARRRGGFRRVGRGRDRLPPRQHPLDATTTKRSSASPACGPAPASATLPPRG